MRQFVRHEKVCDRNSSFDKRQFVTVASSDSSWAVSGLKQLVMGQFVRFETVCDMNSSFDLRQLMGTFVVSEQVS